MSDETKEVKKKVKPIMEIANEYNEAVNNEWLGKSENHETPTLQDLIKQGAQKSKKTVIPRMAFTDDPVSRDNYMGLFKNKRRLLPDWTIKRIKTENHLIAAILRARGNTMSMFGRIRRDRFDIGIECNIKQEYDNIIGSDERIKVEERISRFLNMLINCGRIDGVSSEDKLLLSDFFNVQAQNGLAHGRFATEIVRDEDGDFHRFRPADSGTIYKSVKKGEHADSIRQSSIRLLEQATGAQISSIKVDRFKKDEYAYIQVVENIPRQAFTNEEMIVTSLFPSTDIEYNGYPVTPLDTCIQSVTTHISIDIYNKLYFSNGRAAKGILVIQSDEIDQSTIEGVKQQFNASINSVGNAFRTPVFGIGKDDTVSWMPMSGQKKDGEFQFLYDAVARNILSAFNISPDELPGYGHLSKGTNQQSLCLDLSSKIFIPEGLISIGDLLSSEEEVYTKIWTGKKWENSRVFLSGLKDKVRTKLNNGSELFTSPEHRFRTIGEDGEPSWKHQKDLTIGDFVLVNRKQVEGFDNIPEYNGKKLTKEMMELLGWLTGDGNISIRYTQSTGNIKSAALSFYYHNEKERDLWEKHHDLMIDFGLNPKKQEKFRSEDEMLKNIDRCKWNTVKNSTIMNKLYDSNFIKFLLSLGFRSSTDGKVIPSFIHTLPEEYRSAFLRGLFSADGTRHKEDSAVRIIIHDDILREQTKHLLLSLGIRTQLSEGKIKIQPKYRGGVKILAKTSLAIKDKVLFYEKIGFFQKHKQPELEHLKCPKRWEKLSPKTIEKYVKIVLEKDKELRVLSKSDRNNLYTVLNPSIYRGISADLLVSLMEKLSINVPDWMTSFYSEKVIEIEDLHENVEMADIEVFDQEHAFVANGIIVHNSESSNQYKLTAARDTGLRPLIHQFEDFVNQHLFPIIDPELAQLCFVQISGLDSDTREAEALRLQQDAPLHMTMDEVMEEVNKPSIGNHLAGGVNFNERHQVVVDKYMDTGHFMGHTMDPSYIVDPMLRYRRDGFWFQQLELLMQSNPMAVQALFAHRPDAIDILKMLTKDMLDSDMD